MPFFSHEPRPHPRTRRRDRPQVPVASLAAVVGIGAALCVLLVIAAAVITVRPAVAGEADPTAETVGGVRYSVNNAWILHPRRAVDANVAKGLPAGDAHLPQDQLLYAVFLGVSNETGTPRQMASDIALRDTTYREFAPERMAPDNRFAYRPTVVGAKSQLPAPGTPGATDLSAGGLMLVFRIPRRSYDDGPLQLVLHNPQRPGSVQTVETA
jgi:hypothetical protein